MSFILESNLTDSEKFSECQVPTQCAPLSKAGKELDVLNASTITL